MNDNDSLFDVLMDLFGEVGIWFAPLGVILLAAAIELIYHASTGGWLE